MFIKPTHTLLQIKFLICLFPFLLHAESISFTGCTIKDNSPICQSDPVIENFLKDFPSFKWDEEWSKTFSKEVYKSSWLSDSLLSSLEFLNHAYILYSSDENKRIEFLDVGFYDSFGFHRWNWTRSQQDPSFLLEDSKILERSTAWLKRFIPHPLNKSFNTLDIIMYSDFPSTLFQEISSELKTYFKDLIFVPIASSSKDTTFQLTLNHPTVFNRKPTTVLKFLQTQFPKLNLKLYPNKPQNPSDSKQSIIIQTPKP